MIQIKSIIQGVDQFSNQIGLHMNNSYKYKTTLGGCLTILSFIFILLFFLSKITSFFLKESVYVITNSRYNPNPPRSYMNSNRFMFAVQIEQEDFLTNPFFNITVYQKIFKNEPSTSTKHIEEYEIELEPCTPEHWNLADSYANFTQLFLPYGFNYLCPSKNSVLFLEGMYGSDVFSFFQVIVTPCITPNDPKRKWNPVCAPKEEVEESTEKKGYQGVSFYHSNYALNVDQPSDFFTPFINDRLFFTFVPYKMTRNCDIYLQDVSVQTDESIFFQSETKKFQFPLQKSNDQREITELERPDGRFAILTVRLTPYVTEINRSFKRITSILSELGGFTHLVMASLGLIIKKYNLFEFTIELANKIYQSDQISNSQNRKNKKNKKDQNKKSFQSQNNSNLIENNKQAKEDVFSIFNEASRLGNFNQSQLQQSMFKNQSLQTDQTLKFAISPQLTSTKNLKKRNTFQQSPSPFTIKLYQNSANNSQTNNYILEQKDKLDIPQLQQQEIKKQKKCFKLFNPTSTTSEQKNEEMKQNKEISIIKYMFYYLFPKSKLFSQEGLYVTQAVKMVNDNLDVINIHKKMQEIDKLKHVIFDKHQKRLFDLMSSHKINFQDTQNSDNYCVPLQENPDQLNQQDQIQSRVTKYSFFDTQKQQKLFDSYQQVKCLQEQTNLNSNINQRLINNLGNDIFQGFEQKDVEFIPSISKLTNLDSNYPLKVNTTNHLQKRSFTLMKKKIKKYKNSSSQSQTDLNNKLHQNFKTIQSVNKNKTNSVRQLEIDSLSKEQDSEAEPIKNQLKIKRQIPEENSNPAQILSMLQSYNKQRMLISKQKIV